MKPLQVKLTAAEQRLADAIEAGHTFRATGIYSSMFMHRAPGQHRHQSAGPTFSERTLNALREKRPDLYEQIRWDKS